MDLVQPSKQDVHMRIEYKLDLVAPGHCTGEPEFAALKKIFGDHYLYAGAGTVIELSRAQVASSTSSGGR